MGNYGKSFHVWILSFPTAEQSTTSNEITNYVITNHGPTYKIYISRSRCVPVRLDDVISQSITSIVSDGEAARSGAGCGDRRCSTFDNELCMT